MRKSKAQRKIQKRKAADLETRITAKIEARISALLRAGESDSEQTKADTDGQMEEELCGLFGGLEVEGDQDDKEEERPAKAQFPPVFLVDEAPKANHLRLARERGVPLVVLLTTDHHVDMLDLPAWERRYIPRLRDVHCVGVGDPSFVPLVKQQWLETHRENRVRGRRWRHTPPQDE